MKLIMLFLFGAPIFTNAQDSLLSKVIIGDTGIRFEKGLSWEDIRLKAKSEGKPIFMDCYATWCGPCKFMSQHIFTQKAVGDFMNENFVNVAVQMDRTTKDAEEIKKWYADATTISSTYVIAEYPTYIFFDPNGKPQHRVVGATGDDPMNFISKAKEALNPDEQYYTRIEKYNSHLHDSVFLHNELVAALRFQDMKNAGRLANAYFDCLRDPYNIESVNLIGEAMQSSQDNAFSFFLNHLFGIDSALHEQGVAERIVANVVAGEEIVSLFEKSGSIVNWSKIKKIIERKYPALNAGLLQMIYQVYELEIVNKLLKEPLNNDSASSPDWIRMAGRIRKICPGYNPDSIITMEKPQYYSGKKMWSIYDRVTMICLKRYGNKLDSYDLNGILWNMFMHSDDRKLLSFGAKMARRMVPDLSDTVACRKSEYYSYMDTYANLLYKTGKKGQAILWEQSALNAVQSNPRVTRSTLTTLEITIAKMEKGESTWVGRIGAREEFK